MNSSLKLGTRRSLLAWAQSSWVAREIERLNPGVQVELFGIDTRGDQIQDVSLQSVQGKEFFVAELDDALKSGAVDLTVHSMKDLSLERPSEFVCGAVPKRANPRDVALFGPHVFEKLRAGQPLRIGTSSPRRLENGPAFFTRALPTVGGHAPRVEFVEIRGNVNTRLSRVHEAEGHPKRLDGVILAFAGMIRLWADSKARTEMLPLLNGVRWMVMPLRECPAAPAQGALAVECRSIDAKVRGYLAKLHDEPTAQQVAQERGLLAEWGGGCHQKFGATAVPVSHLGTLFYVRGRMPNGQFIDELKWSMPAPPSPAVKPWDGSAYRIKAQIQSAAISAPHLKGTAVFVAHARALPASWAPAISDSRVWTSGMASWARLAEQGIWVEGCAENLGFDSVAPELEEGVLQLPALTDWTVLTHETAAQGWSGQKVIATYSAPEAYPEEAEIKARQASHFFWSAASQYKTMIAFAPQGSHHSCGPGKTAEQLRELGVDPQIFPSVEEWRKWLKI